jgi:DNA-binding NtrC family response regulator
MRGEEEEATDFHPRPTGASATACFVVTFSDGAHPATVTIPQLVTVLVGHSPTCEVRVTDPKVSRRHLSLTTEGERLHIVDLRSTNGTLVNGVAIVDAYLHGGETVALGSTHFRVTREVSSGVATLPIATQFGHVLGASPQMRRLFPLCERLAASDVPVVIEGETGTGKEVLAESIHLASARSLGPFVVFDCTAVPGNLMESELFGHEKGAFTGATSLRRGLFEQADGGTLLIDEIGDLELSLQPKLLRAVERREVRRLGGDRAIRVDVRLLAATRRDLDREVQAGRFRDDLFHRLAVGRVELPPLRHRAGDIRALATHFFHDFGVVPPADLVTRWEDEPWPGNVRELRNAVARWVAVGELATWGKASPGEEPAPVDAVDSVEHILELKLPLTQARQRLIENFERRYIERMLAEHGGHVGRAAAASGIGRRYFQMLLARRT